MLHRTIQLRASMLRASMLQFISILWILFSPAAAFNLLGDWDGLSDRTFIRAQKTADHISTLVGAHLARVEATLDQLSLKAVDRLQDSANHFSGIAEKHLSDVDRMADRLADRLLPVGHAVVVIALIWTAMSAFGRWGTRGGVVVVTAFFAGLYAMKVVAR